MIVRDAETGQVKFEFLAYENEFRGGQNVAVGDMNCDGLPDIVTGPGSGEKWIRSAVENAWYLLLPNGELRQWNGVSVDSSLSMKTFDRSTYDDPSLLHNATPPPPLLPVDFQVELLGTTLEEGIPFLCVVDLCVVGALSIFILPKRQRYDRGNLSDSRLFSLFPFCHFSIPVAGRERLDLRLFERTVAPLVSSR